MSAVAAGVMLSSSNVFHAPQSGHLPSHFGLTAPQAAHTYWIFGVFMYFLA